MDTEQKLQRVIEALEEIKKQNSLLSFNDGINFSIKTLENWFETEISAFRELESKF